MRRVAQQHDRPRDILQHGLEQAPLENLGRAPAQMMLRVPVELENSRKIVERRGMFQIPPTLVGCRHGQ